MEQNLDGVDRKILYELDLDASMPTSKLAKKLKLSKDRVTYRIQNLVKKGIIKSFVTQIDASKLGYFVYKVFFKFQNLTEPKKQEIVSWTLHDKNVYWSAECAGRWDLNITLFAKNITEFDAILGAFTSKFGKFIAEQEIKITLKVGILNKAWINKTKKERTLKYFWGSSKEIKLDKIDVELLRVLANNARISTVELAQKIKTTPRVAIYRRKELEKKQIILGYTVSLDYEKVKKQFFKANIYFNILTKETKEKIETSCKSRPNVIYFIFGVGSWPLELEFNVTDNKEFYDEMNEFRKAFPEMKNYDMLLFTNEHKFDWFPACYEAPTKTPP